MQALYLQVGAALPTAGDSFLSHLNRKPEAPAAIAEAVVFANHLPEDGQTTKDVFQEALDDRVLGIDDIIAAGPQTVTVFEVRNGDAKHPVQVVTEEYGPERPYKPSQSMRRAMASAWGADVSDYKGRRITLFRNTTIEPSKDELGGIQISHLSHIERPLTVSRGHRATFVVQPLADYTVPDVDTSGRDVR